METDIVCCRCVEVKAVGVEALVPSPDSRWLAVARTNGTVEIYDAATNCPALRLSDENCSSARSLLWIPATRKAAIVAYEAAAARAGEALAFSEGKHAILSRKRGRQEDEREESACELCEWSLVAAGLHGVISEWNLRTQRVQSETPSYGGAIFSLSPPPHGAPANFFAAACDDGRVRLFAVQGAAARAALCRGNETGAETDEGDAGADEEGILLKASLPKTAARLLSVAWYAPGLLFAATAASTILRFSSSSLADRASVASFSSVPRAGAFVADGKMILVHASRARQNRQKESEDGQGESKKGASPVLVWCLYPLPSVHLLLSGDSTGCVTVWSVPTCVALRRLQLHAADVLNLEAHAAVALGGALGKRGDEQGESKQVLSRDRAMVTVVSSGVDGKLAVAIRQKEGDWVAGPPKYPHACDIRGLALLPASLHGNAAGTRKRLLHLASPSSLVAWTGAVDGVIRCSERLTGLASVHGPPPSLPFHPLAAGVLPRISVAGRGKDSLVLSCSDSGLELWNVNPVGSDTLLSQSPLSLPASLSTSAASASIVKLLRVSLRDNLRPRCGDLTPDGTLVAAGSRRGLHLFGVHLKELEIVDVEGGRGCDALRDVRALRFLSNTVLACCCAASRSKKGSRRFRFSSENAERKPDFVPKSRQGEASDEVTHRGETQEKKRRAEKNGRGEAQVSQATEVDTQRSTQAAIALAAAAVEAEWKALGEAEDGQGALPGGYRVVFLDVWRGGTVLGELGPFPHPIRSFDVSDDGSFLSCLFSLGSLLVVSLADFSPVRFFRAFPHSARAPISCACFSPSLPAGPETRRRRRSICLFSTRRQYCVVPLLDANAEEPVERQAEPADLDEIEDGSAEEGATHGRGNKALKETKKARTATGATQRADNDGTCGDASDGRRERKIKIRQIPTSCIAPSDGPIMNALWLSKSCFPAQQVDSYLCPQSSSSSAPTSFSLAESSVLLCLTPSVVCRLPVARSLKNGAASRRPPSSASSSLLASSVPSSLLPVNARGSPEAVEPCDEVEKRKEGKKTRAPHQALSSGSSESEVEEDEDEDDVPLVDASDVSRRTLGVRTRRLVEDLCLTPAASWSHSASSSFPASHVSVALLPLFASGQSPHSPLSTGMFGLLSPPLRRLWLLQRSAALPAGDTGQGLKKQAPSVKGEQASSLCGSRPSPRPSLSTTCSSPSSLSSGASARLHSGKQDGALDGLSVKRRERNEGVAVAGLDQGRQTEATTSFAADKSTFSVLRRSTGHGFLSLLFLPHRDAAGGKKKLKGGDAELVKHRGVLMLIEALDGAAGEPENMEAPFNRKRYGT
ncbi:conserved hypothetical protein [Neospora caninum Liverpool]|uniref:Uncharacterized protein n=1 Tax=Neospora caninum (strain Liverpool) TaxID=572307 RepID=F0VLH1_NEOCL|nr:conserved hypothetical protein [Neospora caninum Liverpool]CBZ54099.1 conserved hypothetical protein [Neospora caninum Liverpool]CEL68798.1 TPA: hypothetical protein BN1204_045320 [Neospora caninum Liverpool]|eukprot:XP_003884130.1 conserved hypothetical protein [Neospora caninum Liverpool]